MNAQQILRDIRLLERQDAEVDVQDLTEIVVSGRKPTGLLHEAYFAMIDAESAFMDATIGGDGYDEALAVYRRKRDEYLSIVPPMKRIDPARSWTPLRPHAEQRRLWMSPARFRVVPAGRRAGKSMLAMRYGVKRARAIQRYPDARYIFAAPVYSQAKRIFWSNLKRLIPRHALIGGDPRRAISESELSIHLVSGAEILVTGLDVPERIEGNPIDFITVDEVGNCRKEAWTEHIRPALSERGGEAWLIGVPEGRNHYYELAVQAQEEQRAHPELWSYHTWPSSDILPAEEIAIAKAELDELTFRQEYEASFVTFEGRVYYPFDRAKHCERLRYNPALDLMFAFDFNVSPGVAAVLQEQANVWARPDLDSLVTCSVDEIWIRQNSNTRTVCARLIERYRNHPGLVWCFGDATGGAGGSAKVEGCDWDIIRACLKPVFGDRLRFRVPAANPRERVRVNAMNSRLMAADGRIRFLVDPVSCPHTVLDFEGTTCTPDGSGDIDKKADPMATHLTDAAGYLCVEKYPLTQHITQVTQC